MPEAEIEESLSAMIKKAGGPEKFDKMLERQKLTLNLVKHGIADGKRVDILIKEVTSSLPGADG